MSLTHVSVAHRLCVTSGEWGLFFVFPYPPFQFFEVSCHRPLDCSWYSVAKTHLIRKGA